MSRAVLAIIVSLGTACSVHAQATDRLLTPLLQQHLQSPSVVADELRRFMLQRVPPLALPSSKEQWDAGAARIREHALSVAFHGWPKEWIDSAPKFEKVGVIERSGYRIVKLRYEIIPGFYSVALLYEPEHISGKVPAILNVNGHGDAGKAVEHKQKRCINQARRGILALSLEWIGMGELRMPENTHQLLPLLDLAGDNGLGLFYLAMRRGLDYLYNDTDVDRSRIGVTGLSGGGWQTIVLSSLDTRVGPAVPVAGFSSLATSIEHPDYSSDDPEQNASDFRKNADYAQLTAMRAPRPTLLIYNDMDNCCFRAGVVKEGVYSDIKPFFTLDGKSDSFQWYENQNPGDHNYQIDNRQVSYKFFDSAFHLNVPSDEDPDTNSEVRSYADLVVGLPKDNLTILKLAQSFARSIHHELPAQPDAQWAQSQRTHLREVTRYTPVTVAHASLINTTRESGLETYSYRFEFSNGLSATSVLFRSTTAPETAPTTIIVSDQGMASTINDVGNDVDRGQQVLVLDPLFFGENTPGTDPGTSAYAQLLNTVGERPLGLEAAQITAVAHWLSKGLDRPSSEGNPVASRVRLITIGFRSQTVAMTAAAIEPELFSQYEARKSIPSLLYAFDHALTGKEAPELMCLDLYRDFDFNLLVAIASPVEVNLSTETPQRLFW
jgi:Prolyl oligopeptidase family